MYGLHWCMLGCRTTLTACGCSTWNQVLFSLALKEFSIWKQWPQTWAVNSRGWQLLPKGCVCLLLFTAIRLCSWCYSRQVSVGWSNCAGARHLSDWFCGRLKNYRCSKYWLLALVCRTFHHQTQGNPRLTTWQMATPDNSPPDKWEPQAIHHQTNGNSRQFTTRQMGNPGSSPPDKWEPQAIHH